MCGSANNRIGLLAALLGAAIAGGLARGGWGQSPSVTVSSPFQQLNDSFFERIGVGFGFNLRGPRGEVFFNQGGVNSAIPPFGGYNPADEARFGFGVAGNNGNFSLNLFAGQGSSRSIVSQTPSVTISNGAQGGFFHGALRPFVTGIAPVLGGRRTSPLIERLQRLQEIERLAATETAGGEESSGDGAAAQRAGVAAAPSGATRSTAQRGDLSVAEIRARQRGQDEAQQRELEALIARAEGLEHAGQGNVARIYYQQAAARASGALQRQLQEKARSLGKQP